MKKIFKKYQKKKKYQVKIFIIYKKYNNNFFSLYIQALTRKNVNKINIIQIVKMSYLIMQ